MSQPAGKLKAKQMGSPLSLLNAMPTSSEGILGPRGLPLLLPLDLLLALGAELELPPPEPPPLPFCTVCCKEAILPASEDKL